VKAGLGREKVALLVVIGAFADGRKEVLAVTPGYRESTENWAAVLQHDWKRLVTFYGFPEPHWRHLRTTNVVESPFAAVRLRTSAAKRFKKVANATALIWRLLMVAEGHFRKLNAPELLAAVARGEPSVDGQFVSSQRRVAA
jgi:transposase-like protein